LKSRACGKQNTQIYPHSAFSLRTAVQHNTFGKVVAYIIMQTNTASQST